MKILLINKKAKIAVVGDAVDFAIANPTIIRNVSKVELVADRQSAKTTDWILCGEAGLELATVRGIHQVWERWQ